MSLSIQDVLDQIAAWHAERPLYKERLYAALLNGEFKHEQTQEFARQFGIIPLYNNIYHGNIYVVCPADKIEWRGKLSEVAYEEGTGNLFSEGVPHCQLYLNFANGLGLSDEDMWNTDYIPAALTFRSYYARRCSTSFLEAVSAHMLGGEAMAPGSMTKIANMFKEKLGLDDKAVAFFVIHDEADAEHSDVGRELLGEFARTEKDREFVLQIVREHMGIAFNLYDEIYEAARRFN